jgi:hypothetical protein
MYKHHSLEMLVDTYGIPDIPAAFANYFHRINTGHYHVIGGRRPACLITSSLPFSAINVWTSIRVQSKSFHHPHDPLLPQTIHASPPSPDWPYGRYDPVIISADPSAQWPHSGLKGNKKLKCSSVIQAY